MTLSRFLGLAALSLLLVACQDDDGFSDSPTSAASTANTPAALQIYFDRFELAAAERGLAIDVAGEGITAEFQDIPDDGVAGTCTYGSHTPGHIVIDQGFWLRANAAFREMIVFHELGHCVLFQGHREGTHPNGTCQSIMRSGLDGCIDNYRPATREFYLDERFAAESDLR